MKRFTNLLSVVLLAALSIAITRLATPARITISWETVSEVNTAGFLIYRSEKADGPFNLLVETPIPAQGDPLTGSSYEYKDRAVIWGQRYFYQLEEVERSGGRSRFPDTVKGRAGLGWGWTMAFGAALAAAAILTQWLIKRPASTQAEDADADTL